ncbi:MAG: hypothetical protein ABIZ30_02390 [Candidatus Limnocylindrales bacterium]
MPRRRGPVPALRASRGWSAGDPDQACEAPGRIAETSDVLRERCQEIGRPFDEISRTVTMEVVIRDSEAAAVTAFDEIEKLHGIRGRIGADGSTRGLGVEGPAEAVADFVRTYADLGIEEVL